MRRHDWERGLSEFTEERKKVAFAFGRDDCVHLAAAWIHRAVRRSAPPRTYSTAAQARRIVTRTKGGLETLVVKEAAALGLAEVAPYKAQRGDLVWLPNEGSPWGGAPGIVDLDGRHAITMTEAGMVRQPLASATRAWRVG